MMTPAMVTGLILAGGEGRRMGGVDKGLQLFQGHPLVAHVMARLRPQVGHVLISANRHRDRYAALGARVLPDTRPGFAGPLAGIEAGLAVCTTPWLVVVPCDGPFLPLDLVARLAAARGAARAVAARVDDRTHPTYALLDVGLHNDLVRDLDTGQRRLHAWLDQQAVQWCDFSSQADAFRNLNTLDDLVDAASSPLSPR